MAACSQVLESPELLTYILQYLNDAQSLVVAARINFTWFEVATRIIWALDRRYSHLSQSGALARVKRARRQIYATKLTILGFDDESDWTSHELFAGLEFPRLKDLALTGFDAPRSSFVPVPPLLQYIQPSLEALTIYDWSETCSKEFLGHVATNCPRLKSINITNAGNHISPADFVNFFALIDQTLQSVELNLDPDVYHINQDLVVQFSRMKLLKKLRIADVCDSSDLKDIKRLNPDPFPNLVEVDLLIDSDAIPYVADIVPNVKVLRLDITGADPVSFTSIAAMSQLRELFLYVSAVTHTTANEILALRSLRQLRTLSLSILESRWFDTGRMTDDEFAHLISGFTDLTTLQMSIDFSNCSAAIFFSISDFCPQLEFLKLGGVFNIEALRSRPPSLFPVLKKLFLYGLLPVDSIPQLTPLQVARLIYDHAPGLEMFDDRRGFAGYSEVVDIWRKNYRSP